MANDSTGFNPLLGHPKYEFVAKIKDAMFGVVVLARNKDSKEEVAIRFFDNRLPKGQWIPLEDKDCLKGITEQERLHHPCILDVKEAIASPPYVGLVMECAPDGDAWRYVTSRGGLPEPEARALFQQIVLGMEYCHAKGASCKDMRLEHSFVKLGGGSGPGSTPQIKLRQFDYSALLQDMLNEFPRSRTGDYMAPEVITSLGGERTEAADAWAAGVALYALLFGRYPFERPEDAHATFARRVQITVHRILKVDYQIPPAPAVSPDAVDLISRLLVSDPSRRLPFQQIKDHPWFQQDLPQHLIHQHQEALGREPDAGQSPAELRALVDQVVAANSKEALSRK